jgi:tetratricopeptide (TPR) repeat protein
MNAEFLARLARAQTEEEKDWLLAELSLSVLSPELRAMVLAAAVPHWFDANILAALQPDLAQQAEALYLELQHLPFVEGFADRGHNIHERTRKAMLKHLWETDEQAFKQFSQRLVDYFGVENPNRIEQIYHAVVADFEAGSSQFEQYIWELDGNFRRGEAEALLAAVQEQVEAKRVPDTFAADVVYWFGQIHFRFYEAQEALSRYDTALQLYEQVGAKLGKANTLSAIGDVLQFLDRRDEALERYDTALQLYEQVGDNLGKANTLKSIGDVLQFLKRCDEALERYDTALKLFEQVGSNLGKANTLSAIGDVLQFLDRRDEALERYDTALQLYEQVGAKLGKANTLRAIGDVLQFLDRRDEALERYDTALQLYEQVGDNLGKANTLSAIGDVLQFLDRRDEALERYDTALQLYEQVGANLGKANTLRAIGRMQQTLMQFEAALNNYQQALNLYQESGDRWSEAMTLQNLAILYNQIGRVREGYVTAYQANSILQDIEVPLSVMPYPNWLKRSIRFANQGKWQLTLLIVVGVLAFPFALSFVAAIFLWRVTFGRLFATQPILLKWRYGLYALLSLAIVLLVAWIYMR